MRREPASFPRAHHGTHRERATGPASPLRRSRALPAQQASLDAGARNGAARAPWGRRKGAGERRCCHSPSGARNGAARAPRGRGNGAGERRRCHPPSGARGRHGEQRCGPGARSMGRAERRASDARGLHGERRCDSWRVLHGAGLAEPSAGRPTRARAPRSRLHVRRTPCLSDAGALPVRRARALRSSRRASTRAGGIGPSFTCPPRAPYLSAVRHRAERGTLHCQSPLIPLP
jgi:hypothetical protein